MRSSIERKKFFSLLKGLSPRQSLKSTGRIKELIMKSFYTPLCILHFV